DARQRVAAVERQPAIESLFHFEGDAVIVRDAGVGLHEQIADFRILPATEDRLAARQHAGLYGVEISCVTRDLPGAEEQVSRRQGDTAADLVRNLDARLVAVRRLDGAVERRGEPEAARRRSLP